MIYRFGSYSFDTDLLEMRDGDTLVTVEPQVFSLLAFLIENRHRVLSKDEIIDNVWEGRIVSDGTLNSRINVARRVVGDNGTNQAVIKTLPRRGFRFVAEVKTGGQSAEDTTKSFLPLPDKPSIAVLPFVNLSGDPNDDYLGDGLAEDIITDLSRIRSFFVISRNSTFQFKGSSSDIRQVSTDLGVRYVVKGGVRKAGNRVRVTVQLIDGANGNHLWVERLDRDIDDILAVQDEITAPIVAQLEPELGRAEYERVRSLPPDNLGAWELYHRGMAHYQRWTGEENLEARLLFQRAVERDKNFAAAYAGIAWTYEQDWFYRGLNANLAAALENAQKSVALDDKNAFAHVALGRAYHLNGNAEAAKAECEIALRLNPSSATAHIIMGLILLHLKEATRAIFYMEQGIRLSPFDPEIGVFESRLALANLCGGNYEVTIASARSAVRNWGHWVPQAAIVAALSHLSRLEEAREELELLREIKEGVCIEFVRSNWPPHHPDYIEHTMDGLRKAGLPE